MERMEIKITKTMKERIIIRIMEKIKIILMKIMVLINITKEKTTETILFSIYFFIFLHIKQLQIQPKIPLNIQD